MNKANSVLMIYSTLRYSVTMISITAEFFKNRIMCENCM